MSHENFNILFESILDDYEGDHSSQALKAIKPIESIFSPSEYDARTDMFCGVMGINVENIKSLKDILEENGIKTTRKMISVPWSDLKKNSDGHVPVVVQDVKTDEVLMVAYMNEEAYIKTLETGTMTYFSRSRNELWIKGATSGHYQYLQSMYLDCDSDT